MKSLIFWDMTPCTLVGSVRKFGDNLLSSSSRRNMKNNRFLRNAGWRRVVSKERIKTFRRNLLLCAAQFLKIFKSQAPTAKEVQQPDSTPPRGGNRVSDKFSPDPISFVHAATFLIGVCKATKLAELRIIWLLHTSADYRRNEQLLSAWGNKRLRCTYLDAVVIVQLVVFSSDKTSSGFLFFFLSFLATTNLIMDCYEYLQLVDSLRFFLNVTWSVLARLRMCRQGWRRFML